MDIDLRKRKKELDVEIANLFRMISLGDDFINTKGKYYTSKESVEALKEMKQILIDKKIEYKKKNDKVIKMKNELQCGCNHEIIIEDNLNICCALCGALIINEKDEKNIVYKIIIPSEDSYVNKIRNKVFEIIENGIESDDLLSYIEEPLEDLQYKTNVKVRKLKL